MKLRLCLRTVVEFNQWRFSILSFYFLKISSPNWHNVSLKYKKRTCPLCSPLWGHYSEHFMTLCWLHAVVCWGGGGTDRKRPNILVTRASSVLDCLLDSTDVVGESRMLSKLTSIMDDTSHLLRLTAKPSAAPSAAASDTGCVRGVPQVIEPHRRQTVQL